ncbi:MAG: toll/interleukin-1 receptor domain-containing protein [Methanosarcina mazei]
MRIFISWSGERSKIVAEALRDWIPCVIQSAKPWVSSKDIFAGEDWNKEIEEKLGELKFGIICLTPENLQAPWIHFEAGSLSCKIKDKTLVCPYLVDLEPEDVAPPLSRFQLVKSNREGTLKIIESINRVTGENSLDKHFLEETFNLWWPKLEEKLSNLPSGDEEHTSKSERNEKEILIEILEIVRNFTTLNSKNQYIILDSKNLFETEVDASGNTFLKPLDFMKLYQAYSKIQTKINDTGDKLSLSQKLFDFDNEKSSKRSDI